MAYAITEYNVTAYANTRHTPRTIDSSLQFLYFLTTTVSILHGLFCTVSSIVCLKEVLWDRNVAYSCEVVCTQRFLSLFVQEYPRITNFISCDTFATGSATELQSQPGLLIMNGEISQTPLCAKYQNII